MLKTRSGFKLAASVAALAAVFAVSAIEPARAQERNSIRWATSSVDSYGYKVAAAMTKIVEEALGGKYTVTVNPYPSTTGAMKAAMDGNGEIGYTADVGMTESMMMGRWARRWKRTVTSDASTVTVAGMLIRSRKMWPAWASA